MAAGRHWKFGSDYKALVTIRYHMKDAPHLRISTVVFKNTSSETLPEP